MAKDNVRYGRKLRLLERAVKDMKIEWYECPSCGKETLRRKGYAIFKCRNCGAEYAGAAYAPTSKR